jgi:type I restriction enzyme S subunit
MKADTQSGWETVPLGTLAQFRNGINYNKDNFGRGIKIINVKDFQDYLVPKYKDLNEINPEGIIREESLLQDGDIIFVRSNGNRELIGRSLFICGLQQRVTHSAFTIRVHFKSDCVLPQFYAYLFRTSLIRQALSAYGSGTNISNLNQEILSNLQVPLPPLQVQKRIVGVLSVYDDLIENNTQRIKILEEMAQELYREWFVKFRFPGHETVKMVESELEMVPEGWEVGTLKDALILQRGFDLPTKKREEGNIPIYAATGIVGTHNEAKVKSPCVVTGRSGSIGTVIYVDEDFWPLNTTLWVKDFRRATPIYAFYLLKGLDLSSFNSGAAVPTLNRNDIHGLPVILPSFELLKRFNQYIIPIFSQKKILKEKNANLRRTRDLLLPKLISGNQNVESLDICEER